MASCPKCGANVIREWINKKKHRRAGVCGGCGKTVDLGRIEETETGKEDGRKKTAGTETKTATNAKPARTPRRAGRATANSGTSAERKSDGQGKRVVRVSAEGRGSGIAEFCRKYIW
jgi:DNA-directed RNA polymerase subunit M/transcription elongation factor TFIIS